MAHPIRVTVGDVVFSAELNDSPTAAAILAALPIEESGNRWGDEIYFAIPVHEKAAPDARADMEVGELAYWPPGHAFCIFFGPTPASDGDAPRAASPVNPIGQITDEVEPLKKVADGAVVRIEKA
jgi:hypothetical protein